MIIDICMSVLRGCTGKSSPSPAELKIHKERERRYRGGHSHGTGTKLKHLMYLQCETTSVFFVLNFHFTVSLQTL